MSESESDEYAIWIRTVPSPDGTTYMATVEVGEDRSIPLAPDTAPRYAMTIMAAVARAEYDAAVYRQLIALQLDQQPDQQLVKKLIVDLRKDRPGIDYAATKPLQIEPGVNAEGKAFLTVRLNGEPIGQWGMWDARQHALAAMEASMAADLDSGYYRALVGLVGLAEPPARSVVDDLANHRPPPDSEETIAT